MGQGEWAAPSLTVETDRGEETFVQVEKTKTWVFKAVAPPRAVKGVLRRVQITSEIIKRIAKDMAMEEAPVADDSQQDSPEQTKKDKVDDLDTLEGEAGPVPKQPKPKKQRNVVLSLEYPRLCPLSQEGAASEEKVTVRVLKRHSQQLWVSERSIPWLIQYMATEHALGGIPEKPGNPGAASDSAVAASPIKWDYESNDGYHAKVNGSMVRCAISTFNQAKWDKVDAVYHYKTTFSAASREEVGQACHDTLVEYLKSME